MTSDFDTPPAHSERPALRRVRRRARSTGALAAVLTVGLTLTLTDVARAASSVVPLGAAESFAVLAATGITNTGPTTINGDIGSSPTGSIGTTGMTLNGNNYGNGTESQSAQTSATTTYNYLESAPSTGSIPAGTLTDGQTLTPGVYTSPSSIMLNGSLTLDGGGDPNAIFIFQAPSSTLTTATGSSVNLIGDAQACNVFWQVGSSATLGTTTTFRGTIVALTSITLTTDATVQGRLLARNGAVTLDENTVTAPTCADPVVMPPPAPPVVAPPVVAPVPPVSDDDDDEDGPQIRRVPVGSVDTGDGTLLATARLWSHGGGTPSA